MSHTWYEDLITAPSGLAVDVAYVRDDHLRVTAGTVEDTKIQRAIEASTQACEAFTGRSLLPQTWALVLTTFPTGGLLLPRVPLIDVTSIAYSDENGDPQTLASNLYNVQRQSGPQCRRSWIDPIPDTVWPATQLRRDAVTVTYRAGYVETPGASPEVTNIPSGLKEGIAMRAAELYKQRSDSIIGIGVVMVPAFAGSRALWHPYKVY